MTSRHSCSMKTNNFSYICGEYIMLRNRKKITDFVKEAYRAYFGINIGDPVSIALTSGKME